MLRKFRRLKTDKKTTLNQIIDAADDSGIVLSNYCASMMDEPDEPMEVASVQFTSVLPVDSVPIEVDNVPSDVDVLPSSNERDVDVVLPVLDEKPAKKVGRGSAQFTVSFTDSQMLYERLMILLQRIPFSRTTKLAFTF